MRLAPLVSGLALLLLSAPAFADDIGTRPAMDAAKTEAAPISAPAEGTFQTQDIWRDEDRESRQPAPIAVDPPRDWAVLHAGLRPHLGTFGGIATFSLAQNRTERFYGVFSLSAIRNDAGTHVGLAQIALGRNLSDSFYGVLQLSLAENRVRHFYGVGQLGLAYDRAGDMNALFQAGGYQRNNNFNGVIQTGAYVRTEQNFNGLAQVGLVSSVGPALVNDDYNGKERFAGLTQVGVWASVDGSFKGLTQIGVASLVTNEFDGLVQIGGMGAAAKKFRGLAQIGTATFTRDSVGMQLGAVNISTKEHTGLQVGGLANYGSAVDGAQIGIANLGRRVRGVQIGVFNYAKHLRGVQIGLANHAEDGVLPWTAILNMGFGDGDGGGDTNVDDDVQRAAYAE